MQTDVPCYTHLKFHCPYLQVMWYLSSYIPILWKCLISFGSAFGISCSWPRPRWLPWPFLLEWLPYLSVKFSELTLGSDGTSVSKPNFELENNDDIKYKSHHLHLPPFTTFTSNLFTRINQHQLRGKANQSLSCNIACNITEGVHQNQHFPFKT